MEDRLKECGFCLFPKIHPALPGLEGIGNGVFTVAKGQFSGGQVKTGRGFEGSLPVTEGADHQDLLASVLPGVDIVPAGKLVILPDQCRLRTSQTSTRAKD